MKIVLIEAMNITGGGSLQVALSIINNASKQGDTRWFLAISREISEQVNEKTKNKFEGIFILEGRSLFDKTINLFKIKNIINQIKPDLVFTVFGPAYWKPKAKHLQGFALPLLIYPLQDWYNPNNKIETFKQYFVGKIKIWFLRKDCFYVVETETVKERLSSTLNVPDEKIFVVKNSVSPIFYEHQKKSKDKKKNNKTFNILIPSSYYAHKNLEIVPRVASELLKKGFEEFRFVFILPEQSNGWKNILKMARELNVEDKIESLGALPHVKMTSAYQVSDLVLLPTLVEASTAVYPESFLSNRGLITSSRPFAIELCRDGAIYVDPRNPKDIADKIIEIKNNKKRTTELIRRGRRTLRDNYPSPAKKWETQYAIIKKIMI